MKGVYFTVHIKWTQNIHFTVAKELTNASENTEQINEKCLKQEECYSVRLQFLTRN